MASFFKPFWYSNTTDDDEKFEIEFKEELDSITSLDPVLSIFKLANFDESINQYLSKQFNNKLTTDEHAGIYNLFLSIYEQGVTSQSQLNVYSVTKIGIIIPCYFASLSPTNTDAFGCWNTWICYLMDNDILLKLGSVNDNNLINWCDTLSQEIGYDNDGGLIWFISTERFDEHIDNDTNRKGFLLFMISLVWNLKTNTFDLNVLRRGIKSHFNLSHFSMTRVSWSTVEASKGVISWFPFALNDIFFVNTPRFIQIFKKIAERFFLATSLEKFIWLDDMEQYFAQYAPQDTTPIGIGGTLELNTTEWMKKRGFFQYQLY